jgi:hypothetical protein
MNRKLKCLLALAVTPLLLAANCNNDGPGTPSYNARHHINPDESQHAMPNPDPKPEKRGPGRPPTGKYVSFHVSAAATMGTLIVTWKVGGGEWQTFHMKGTKHWGTMATVGTPVSLLAAPDEQKKPDGTFKHGALSVRITREPANETEGGTIVCQDNNSSALTGGAQCAGTV